jgi:predicted Zn-dependent protease
MQRDRVGVRGARISRRVGWAALLASLFVVLGLAGCTTVQTTQGGVVGIERKQTMSTMISPLEMEGGAAQAYSQLIGAAQEAEALDVDPEQTRRIQAIASRIIPQTAVFRSDAVDWKWEVHVLKSDEVNAWCMPGGKIAFYSGILEKLELSDDEAAAIMGHEIAHALREHGRERASQKMNQQIGISVVGTVLGLGMIGEALADQVATWTVGLPNSREQETESDRIGVELAARAGYDPRAAVTLWEKMAKQSQGGPPQWLSTHPAAKTRIADLQGYSQRVMPLYEQARQEQGQLVR